MLPPPIISTHIPTWLRVSFLIFVHLPALVSSYSSLPMAFPMHSVATVSGHNTWHFDRISRWSDWRRYDERQRSDTLDLHSNSSYLLVGLMKQAYSHDFLRVSTLLPAVQVQNVVLRRYCMHWYILVLDVVCVVQWRIVSCLLMPILRHMHEWWIVRQCALASWCFTQWQLQNSVKKLQCLPSIGVWYVCSTVLVAGLALKLNSMLVFHSHPIRAILLVCHWSWCLYQIRSMEDALPPPPLPIRLGSSSPCHVLRPHSHHSFPFPLNSFSSNSFCLTLTLHTCSFLTSGSSALSQSCVSVQWNHAGYARRAVLPNWDWPPVRAANA